MSEEIKRKDKIDDCICGHPFVYDRMRESKWHLPNCPKFKKDVD